jgi:hypothetical protein
MQPELIIVTFIILVSVVVATIRAWVRAGENDGDF